MRSVSLLSFALIFTACSSSSPASTTGTIGASGSASTTGTTTAASTTGTVSSTTGAAATSGTTSGASGTSGAGGSSSGGVIVGSACNPSAAMDACAASGLACESNNYVGSLQDGGQGGNCELPAELQGCQSRVGCDDPSLTCTDLPLLGASACLRDCTDDGNCPLPFTTCGHQFTAGQEVCFYDFCDSPPPIAQDVTYYSACAASDAGAGTCVPVANATYTTVGLCLEGGTAPDGGACDAFRDGGTATECGVGQACDGLLFGQINGACRQLCSFDNDGGPACGSGQVCSNSESIGVPSSLDWGVCLTPCSASNGCAAGTCLAVSSTSEGVCFP